MKDEMWAGETRLALAPFTTRRQRRRSSQAVHPE
jgi:hypothetical protein